MRSLRVTRRLFTSQPELKKCEAAVLWAQSAGAQLSPSVRVGFESGCGYSLLATQNIAQGEILVTVPETCWKPFSAANAELEVQTKYNRLHQLIVETANKLMPNQRQSAAVFVQSVCLALVMFIKHQAHHPYAEFLWTVSFQTPHAVPLPIMMDVSKYLNPFLAGTKVREDIIKRQQLYRHVAEELMPHAMNLLNRSLEGSSLPDQLLWGLSMILSRGLSGAQFPLSMVPVLDFANHSDVANASHEFSTGKFRLTARRNITADEPICIDYGSGRDSSSFVALYGFLGGQRAVAIDTRSGIAFHYNPLDKLVMQCPAVPMDMQLAVAQYLQTKFSPLFLSGAVEVLTSKGGLRLSAAHSTVLQPDDSQFSMAVLCLVEAFDLFSDHPQSLSDALDETTRVKQREPLARRITEILRDALSADVLAAYGLAGDLDAERFLTHLDEQGYRTMWREHRCDNGTRAWMQICGQIQANKLRALLNILQAVSDRRL